MAAATPITPLDPRVEMFRTTFSDDLFNMKALAPRPQSSVTLIYDTEFEDDESSDIEVDEEAYSPRMSLHSAARRSQTTLSSFEEIHTPKDPTLHTFDFDLVSKAVEGPRGPHLFRSSIDSSNHDDYILTMSPLTPITPMKARRPETAFKVPPLPYPMPDFRREFNPLPEADADLQTADVERWTPQQVKRWMQKAGIEPSIIEKFEENDISGEVLTTLKFEDLRELDIRSLGKRHKLWNAIHNLRGDAVADRTSPTVLDCSSDEGTPQRKPKSVRKRNRRPREEIISPPDDSIVGIEQLIRPHKCAKGENCSKFRKQRRMIETFNIEHPVSPKGGMILVAGDPGNPLTAEASRPFSEAQPSVVASSDVLGPDTLPSFQPLREAMLANVASRDPQDNVKQFLNFQRMEDWVDEGPATPPNEEVPAPPLSPSTPATPSTPHRGLQTLPKLAIPGTRPTPGPTSTAAFSPYPMDRAEALSPDLRNATRSPQNVYRFGTPFSDMDVPLTSINLGPVSREISQSVPPNMNFRTSNQTPMARSQSRSSRRPSFPVLPPVEENAPLANPNTFPPAKNSVVNSIDDVSHAGWMKKRKTRMLRHEWHEHHFTLTGTRLAMHKDEQDPEVLESIDVDDYAIACSSLASSKLNAAFKAMNIMLGKDKGKTDNTAFSFQLIPAAIEKGQRLKKRDAGQNSSTKTHHFAVKTRDQRIDWMRELMLAKALKQKGEGFEISLNGNMI